MRRLGLVILVSAVLGVAMGPRLMLATHVAVAHGPVTAADGGEAGSGVVCGSTCCGHGHVGGGAADGSGEGESEGDGCGDPGEPCDEECAGCEMLSGLAAASPEGCVGVERSWGGVGRLWVVDGRAGPLRGPRSVLGRGPPLV